MNTPIQKQETTVLVILIKQYVIDSNFTCAPTFLDLLTWLSSRNFFRVGKIYCYANFFHYANFSIVFGPNFGGGQTASGGGLSGTKPANSVTAVIWVIMQTHLSTLVIFNADSMYTRPHFPTIEPFILLLPQDSTKQRFDFFD